MKVEYSPELLAYMKKKNKSVISVEVAVSDRSDFEVAEIFLRLVTEDFAVYLKEKKRYRSVKTEQGEVLFPPYVLEIDPVMDVSEKRIARVYRDARIIGNGPFFRDHIWCTFGRGRDAYWGFPCYYFELSPRGFAYGMGYYVPAKETLEAIRDLILSEDKLFKKAFRAHKKQKVFMLEGESYKRNHFPEAPEPYWDWLNRKTFIWNCKSDDFGLLFSEELAETVAEDFLSIAPIYQFLIKAESSWRV